MKPGNSLALVPWLGWGWGQPAYSERPDSPQAAGAK